MKEPKEVKPTKDQAAPSKEVLDLDKLSDTELKVVSNARESAARQLANFKLNPGVTDAIKDMASVGERMREMFSNLPSMAMPNLERPEMKMDFTIPPNPQYETNKLLREVSSKLDNLKEQNAKLVAPNYDPDSCTIIFGNKLIKLKKNTKQADLCNALFSKPKKKWDWDEMLEHWGERDYTKEDWRKVYEAARSVNEKVAIKTGVEDLLDYDKLTVMLNGNYMP